MARIKFDGVVQAVHYNPDGQVAWVRAYLRRGPTFSDRVLIDRPTLVASIKSGKRYFTGQRQAQMASTFSIGAKLHVLDKNGKNILVTGEWDADHDYLEGVPVL
jgi:hypothetical protein